MDTILHITSYGCISALCWLVVAITAGLGVFSQDIHDTVPERLGLSALSITAAAAAYRSLVWGYESPGDAALAFSAALYSTAILHKHWMRYQLPRSERS